MIIIPPKETQSLRWYNYHFLNYYRPPPNPTASATPTTPIEEATEVSISNSTTTTAMDCEKYNSCIQSEIGASSQSCSSEQSDQCKAEGGYCGDPSKCKNNGLITGNDRNRYRLIGQISFAESKRDV